MTFKKGDAVENVPATVDGIVYAVEGDAVRFCDEHNTYRMSANGLRERYGPFPWAEKQAIFARWPHLFKRGRKR